MAISQFVLAPETNFYPVHLDAKDSNFVGLPTTFENWVDGIFIFDRQGKCIMMNQTACQMAKYLSQVPEQWDQISHAIWQTCSVIINHSLNNAEFEISLDPVTRFRIRGLTLQMEDNTTSSIQIILEDQRQSIEHLVNTEALMYRLTLGEKAVCKSYQDIAQVLYLSVNTIKKHLKNIRIKQRSQQELPLTG
jgi:DNA-binding CsgD family transcriptional regulator